MTTLMRAQIGKATGIDTTVKSATGLWKALAPTWPMVMGLKQDKLTKAEYREAYEDILRKVPEQVWHTLAEQPSQTLLCYCRDGWFCHTDLIIDYAIAHWPDRFQDGRH